MPMTGMCERASTGHGPDAHRPESHRMGSVTALHVLVALGFSSDPARLSVALLEACYAHA